MNRIRWIAIGLLSLALAGCGSAGSTAQPLAPTEAPVVVAQPRETQGPPPESASPTLLPTPDQTAEPGSTQTATPDETATEAAAATPEGDVAARGDLAGKLLLVRGNAAWLYRPRTGELRQLLEDTREARWSPDGKAIAFVREDGLYLADADGGNERRAHTAAGINHVEWAPDGKKIAFNRGTPAEEPGTREVRVYELDTGDTRTVGQGADPAWAPDSMRIAYVTVAPMEGIRRGELRLVNWKGENGWAVVKDLPPDTPPIGIPGDQRSREQLEHVMHDPFWDNEGLGRFVYVPSYVNYQALSGFSIWERADPTNGGSVFLGELPETWQAVPSPDRRAVVFVASSARGDSWFEARSIGGDDGAWSWAATEKGISAFPPAWSPDGSALAYYRCSLEAPDQCTLDVRTPRGNETVIPDVFGGQAPDLAAPPTLDWARDG